MLQKHRVCLGIEGLMISLSIPGSQEHGVASIHAQGGSSRGYVGFKTPLKILQLYTVVATNESY